MIVTNPSFITSSSFFNRHCTSFINLKVVSIVFAVFAFCAMSLYLYGQHYKSKFIALKNRVVKKTKPLNLILHVDINRTIIADDLKAGFTCKDVLAMITAENSVAKWDNRSEMTFHEYVCSLIPGQHNGAIKKQRQTILKEFIQLLKTSKFSYTSPTEELQAVLKNTKKQVLDDLRILKEKAPEKLEALKKTQLIAYSLMKEKLKENPCNIFPSFFRLIEWLKLRKNLNYHIVLRTFGPDAQRTALEIEKKFPDEQFTHYGTYLKGKWTFHSIVQQTPSFALQKASEVYQFFKSKKYKHLFVTDDYQEWSKHLEHQNHGKRFFAKINSKGTLAMFFDDNLEITSRTGKNIVSIVDVKNNVALPIDPFVEKKMAFRVNTMQAILDDNYYVHLVEDSLKTNGMENYINNLSMLN